jgi:hypothetical protein
MPSRPGHFCDLTMVGEVENFYRTTNGRIGGLLVSIDLGEPALIPVLLAGGVSGFCRGDRLWIRGVIGAEKVPEARYPLVYVKPQHLEIVNRHRPR